MMSKDQSIKNVQTQWVFVFIICDFVYVNNMLQTWYQRTWNAITRPGWNEYVQYVEELVYGRVHYIFSCVLIQIEQVRLHKTKGGGTIEKNTQEPRAPHMDLFTRTPSSMIDELYLDATKHKPNGPDLHLSLSPWKVRGHSHRQFQSHDWNLMHSPETPFLTYMAPIEHLLTRVEISIPFPPLFALFLKGGQKADARTPNELKRTKGTKKGRKHLS